MTTQTIFLKYELKMEVDYPLPPGYQFRRYKGQADTETWVDILLKTKEFSTKEEALNRFNQEFFPHMQDVKERMIFLETNDGKVIGSATAWYGRLNDQLIGRLHWVEIIPEYQARGLGRPLITEAMKILKTNHKQSYLTTQSRSMIAIHLYLNLGWRPLIDTKERKEAWESLAYDNDEMN